MRIRPTAPTLLVCAMLLGSSQPAFAQFSQQGAKLVGSGGVTEELGQGGAVALSADGNTAIVGGDRDDTEVGAVWVWTRSGGVWTQQGSKLVGSGAVGRSAQGTSVALSADGNTAIVGGNGDNSNAGAAWIWTRSGGVWTQQGSKLVGTGAVGSVAAQGTSVSISADGNTAIVGGYGDNSSAGAAWVWTRSGGVWTQQGSKLVGSGAVGAASQGVSVSIAADGNTAIVGGQEDNTHAGAAWVWTRSGGVWTQEGSKLVGSGAVNTGFGALQGGSVALSADGNTAMVGGSGDNGFAGAAWVWTRSGGVWTQQGSKLVGSGAVGSAGQGSSVSLSSDGNTAIVGGDVDDDSAGAVWVWRRNAGTWTQQGAKLFGSGDVDGAEQGYAVALSSDGKTAIVGGPNDNSDIGAAWVFFAPSGISGRVTSATTSLGLANTGVQFYDLNTDGDAGFTTTDASGYYTVNLPAGDYAVLTQDTHGYINEIWNNIPCSAVCDADALSPIHVTDSPITGIDFALDPGGRVSGTVTSSATGLPIAGVRVNFVDPNAQVIFTTGLTDASGNYITDGGTGVGTVYAFTTNTQGYRNETYNNVYCLECDPTEIGTGIPVTLANTTGINFILDVGGRISGTVTDTNNTPLANITVRIADAVGFHVDTATTDGSGNYTSAGLPAGNYFAFTYQTPGKIDKLYNNIDCPGGFCNYTAGTSIPVTVGASSTGRNFVLASGGTITGTVTNGGVPVQDVNVVIYSSTGTFVSGPFTGGNGMFSVVVPAGTYYAMAQNNAGFANIVYNGLPCPNICTVTNGTPLVVAVGGTVNNVNFALTGSGTISGTVTNAAGGAAINGMNVQLFSSAGTTLGSTNTNAGGGYLFAGLAPGSYYVRTNGSNAFAFINQLHSGVTCVACAINSSGGTLVPVTANTTTTINFALTTGGRISGTISAAAGGALLSGIGAQIFSATGVGMGTFNTNASGVYTTSGLPAGTYYVRTGVPAAQNYLDELWNDIPCVPCTVTAGTAVVVTGTATTGNINFALAGGGTITGTVTDSVTGAGVVTAMIVYDTAGFILKTTTTDSSGNYSVGGLPAGTYFVRNNPNATTQNYVTQLYNGVSYGGVPTVGTPVTVTVGATHSGVNFSLVPGGSLTGTVTDAGTTGPLSGVQIGVYSTSGSVVKFVATDAAGGFTVTGLQAGTYYASTSAGAFTPFYQDELFDNLACIGCVTVGAAALPIVTLPCTPSCVPTVTTGTGLVVTNGATRTGVDFALASGGASISGAVTDAATGRGLTNVQVTIYNSSGVPVKTVTSQANTGAYTARGLAPGTYYARTVVSALTPYYTDEAYLDVPCAPCDVTTTTAIVAGANTVTDVDFALLPGGAITGSVTDGATTNPLSSVDVRLFNSAGTLLKTTTTGLSGAYTLDGLPAGTYYARTAVSGGSIYINELYDNLPCVACTVTTGTAITVTNGATHSAVNFGLLPPAPSVVTSAATSVTTFAATLNGTVNPNGSATTALFEYGLTTGYGTQVAVTPAPGSGSSVVGISRALASLACSTLYHFRAVATGPGGTTNGTDLTFTTGVCPLPTVVTGAASSVAATTATLNATVNPNGGSATALFDYGLTTGYGSQVSALPVPGSGVVAVAVSAGVTSLTCNTLYHFRATATTTGGTTNGLDATFTTGACPPSIAPIANVFTRVSTPIAVPVALSGGVAGPVAFTVGATSSNPTLVPNANLVFSGSGANRTLTLTPAAGQQGIALITVTATEGGLGAERSFTLLVGRPAPADVDGDGKSDVTVFRPSTGIWYLRNVITGLFEFYQWGLNGDVPVIGDYDGDRKADVSVYRPSTGIWYIRNSSNGSLNFLQWGLAGSNDIPVPGDFDGDGKTDATVFRPSTGIWYVRDLVTNTASFYQWGINGDIPVPADYDGDGKTDVAVYRPSTGIWYIRNSSDASLAFLQWGLAGSNDIPAPGDYDGDGKADATVFRPGTGIWYVRDLVTNTASFYQWGLNGDIPVPGDFDGDGKTDVAVFRPSTSIWYVRGSSNGAGGFYQWGTTGDIPVLKRPE